MKRLTTIAMTSVAALALAACGSEDVENTAVDDVDEIVDEDVNEEPFPVAGELNEDQQLALDEIDLDMVSEEYDANMDAMREEMSSDDSSGDATEDSGMESALATEETSSEDSGMPARGDMDFGWLDRDEDGQLSVAEYAVWALPADPADMAPNDAQKPYLTDDEINTAAETFFYFDEDGDSYLSPEEFTAARESGRTA